MGLLSKVASFTGNLAKKVTGSALGVVKSVAAKIAPQAKAILKPSVAVAAAAKAPAPVQVKAMLAAATIASTPVGRKIVLASNPVTAIGSKLYTTATKKQQNSTMQVTPTQSTKSAGNISAITNYVAANPIKTVAAIGAAGAALYGVEQFAEKLGVRGGAGFIGAKPRKKRKKSKKAAKRRTSRRRSKSRKKRYGTSKQYARKGGKKVYRTKKGQPYILLASGKARFVKR
jgi:hypothetical protein